MTLFLNRPSIKEIPPARLELNTGNSSLPRASHECADPLIKEVRSRTDFDFYLLPFTFAPLAQGWRVTSRRDCPLEVNA
jgi:hypothetical protein